jgi:hypothetical protein
MSKPKHEIVDPAWDNLAYYSIGVSAARTLMPEERFFLAVILQAVGDATSRKPSSTRSQARDVIFSSSATPLKEMCLCLNIDYDYFRRNVRKMIDEGRTLRLT